MRVKSLKLEMNHDGFAQILQSAEVTKLIQSYTEQIAEDAGEGFEYEVKAGVRHGSPRAVGTVWAATREAREAEATNKVLTAALGGGGK